MPLLESSESLTLSSSLSLLLNRRKICGKPIRDGARSKYKERWFSGASKGGCLVKFEEKKIRRTRFDTAISLKMVVPVFTKRGQESRTISSDQESMYLTCKPYSGDILQSFYSRVKAPSQRTCYHCAFEIWFIYHLKDVST